MLNIVSISSFTTHSGYHCDLEVSYQLAGQVLGTAPVVLVNHALTGNSTITGDKGWWSDLIGKEKAIDTGCYTILSIDIPGNGHASTQRITAYKEFTNYDIARIHGEVLQHLNITSLFAVVGGSLGGQIAWELASQQPKLIKHLIPIATDWKATDWVIAQCHIQDSLLTHSSQPVADARMHAMTFYRTPASFKEKFNRSKRDEQLYNTQSWLNHHGIKLSERFSLSAYRLMNQLLLSADITQGSKDFKESLCDFTGTVHQVAIDTDGLFLADEMYETHLQLQEMGVSSTYDEIKSIHGHDAFLIEYEQLSSFVKPIFSTQLCHK
ncbi:alpha/beta fold hydrolase [Dokdonia sp. R86516]|uniref:alpha/beta fold hydrolase n=1 Tax=Dokdonia sp. R86516 TaxID=3093856 RepID=UPI0037C803C5